MQKKLLPLLVPSLFISMMLHCSDNDFRAKDIRPLVKIVAEDTHELEKVEEIHLDEAESSLIGKITSIQIASNGNLYINDESSAAVHVYSSQGKFIRSFGSFGQGPGEFQHNIIIRVSRDQLGVVDIGARRISFFSLDGTYLQALNWAEDPDILTVAGNFDFSSDGTKIYLDGISKKLPPEKICAKSFSIVQYNSRMQPITVAGAFDPYSVQYCDQFNKRTIVRVDAAGNIYTMQELIPRISRYAPDFGTLEYINIYTPQWELAFSETRRFDYMQPDIVHSRAAGLEIGKVSGNIYSYHFTTELKWTAKEGTRQREKVMQLYLTVLDSAGNVLISGTPLPINGPFGIDDKEYLYHFIEDLPDQRVLAKYRLKPIIPQKTTKGAE